MIALLAFVAGAATTPHPGPGGPMDLGNFSVSLSVKDMAVAKAFYAKLGFEPIAGKEEDGWLILKNGDAKIGLFKGMFEGNLLTFNPPDVRAIHRTLKADGITMTTEQVDGESGPAHFVTQDPDGNVILMDQHQ